jgi:hypothetical protein
MRAVWSFWSEPFRAYNHRTWCTPMHHLLGWWLSLQTASQHYPNTLLVTDSEGKRLLIDRLGLPFKEVSTELDRLAGVNPDWWSMGKLVSYSLQTAPFIHIDTDVFLWKPIPRDVQEAPVFAQCRDEFGHLDGFYRPRDVEFAFAEEKLPLPAEWEYVRSKNTRLIAENCGILGGTNVEFLRYYSQAAMQLIVNRRFSPAWSRIADKKPYNVVMEQFFLSACVEFHRHHLTSPYRGVTVKHLFRSWQEAYDGNHAARLGYTHLLGESKASIVIGKRLEERVRREDSAFLRVCHRVVPSATI